MNLLDDEFDESVMLRKARWKSYMPYWNWKAYWLHSSCVTILSFCFLFADFFESNLDVSYLSFLIVGEVGVFWRYIEFFEDILVCLLLAVFGVTYGGIMIAELGEFFNSISPYDWLYFSGSYRMGEKTMIHIALEASLVAVCFTMWTLLLPFLKKVWEYHFVNKS